MRLAVTGPDGQLGDDLARAARDAGHDVLPLDRAALDLADTHRIASAMDGLEFDALVNCAGYTAVDAAESDREAAFLINARAAGALAGACAAHDARLVQLSTDYVFDGRARRPYREHDPPSPINVYGASKLAGEEAARAEHPEGTLVVRTASLFGVAGARRADAGRPGNFVETMIRRGTGTGRLRVVEDITMSPTWTADLARAILTLLETGAPAGTYHVANAGAATWYELARAIVDLAGVPATVEPVPASEYPTAAARPAYSVLDCGKAIEAGCLVRPWREALEGYLRLRERS